MEDASSTAAAALSKPKKKLTPEQRALETEKRRGRRARVKLRLAEAEVAAAAARVAESQYGASLQARANADAIATQSIASGEGGSAELRRIYDRVQALEPRVEELAADRARLEAANKAQRELSGAREDALEARLLQVIHGFLPSRVLFGLVPSHLMRLSCWRGRRRRAGGGGGRPIQSCLPVLTSSSPVISALPVMTFGRNLMPILADLGGKLGIIFFSSVGSIS